ncbi:MAG TPA: hypothetical protein PKH33_10350 [bacterium]|nr:hypothetical protein [bacterium]
MTEDDEDLGARIESGNFLSVTVEFRLRGLLTTDEMNDAFLMERAEWVRYMREKAGLEPKPGKENVEPVKKRRKQPRYV